MNEASTFGLPFDMGKGHKTLTLLDAEGRYLHTLAPEL